MQKFNDKDEKIISLLNEDWVNDVFWKNKNTNLKPYYKKVIKDSINESLQFIDQKIELSDEYISELKKLNSLDVDATNFDSLVENSLDESIKKEEEKYNEVYNDYTKKIGFKDLEIKNENSEYNGYLEKIENSINETQKSIAEIDEEVKEISNNNYKLRDHNISYDECFTENGFNFIYKKKDNIQKGRLSRDNEIFKAKQNFKEKNQKLDQEIIDKMNGVLNYGSYKDQEKFKETVAGDWIKRFEDNVVYSSNRQEIQKLKTENIKLNDEIKHLVDEKAKLVEEYVVRLNEFNEVNEYNTLTKIVGKKVSKKIAADVKVIEERKAKVDEIDNKIKEIDKKLKGIKVEGDEKASVRGLIDIVKSNEAAILKYENDNAKAYENLKKELQQENDRVMKMSSAERSKNKVENDDIVGLYDALYIYNHVLEEKEKLAKDLNTNIESIKKDCETNEEKINNEIKDYFKQNPKEYLNPKLDIAGATLSDVVEYFVRRDIASKKGDKIKSLEMTRAELVKHSNDLNYEIKNNAPMVKASHEANLKKLSEEKKELKETEGKNSDRIHQLYTNAKNTKKTLIASIHRRIDDKLKVNAEYNAVSLQDLALRYVLKSDNTKFSHVEKTEELINSLNETIDSDLSKIGVEKLTENSSLIDIVNVKNLKDKLYEEKRDYLKQYIDENYYNVKNSLKQENEELKAHIYAKEKNVIDAFKGKNNIIKKGYSANHLWIRGSNQYKEMEKTLNEMFKAKDADKVKYFDTLKSQARDYLEYKKVDKYDTYKNVTKRRMQYASSLIAYIDAYKLVDAQLNKANQEVVNVEEAKPEVKVVEPKKEEIKVVEVEEVKQVHVVNENPQEEIAKVLQSNVVSPKEFYDKIITKLTETYYKKVSPEVFTQALKDAFEAFNNYPLEQYKSIDDVKPVLRFMEDPITALNHIEFDDAYLVEINKFLKQVEKPNVENLLGEKLLKIRNVEDGYTKNANKSLEIINKLKTEITATEDAEKINELNEELSKNSETYATLQNIEMKRIFKAYFEDEVPMYYFKSRMLDVLNGNYSNKISFQIDIENEKLKEEVDNYLKNVYFKNKYEDAEKASYEKNKVLYEQDKETFITSWIERYLTLEKTDGLNKEIDSYLNNVYFKTEGTEAEKASYEKNKEAYITSWKDNYLKKIKLDKLNSEIDSYLNNVYFKTATDEEKTSYENDKEAFITSWKENYLTMIKNENEEFEFIKFLKKTNKLTPMEFYNKTIKDITDVYSTLKNKDAFISFMKYELEAVDKYIEEQSANFSDKSSFIKILQFKENPIKALSSINFDINYQKAINELIDQNSIDLVEKTGEKLNDNVKPAREFEETYNPIADKFIKEISGIQKEMAKEHNQDKFIALKKKLQTKETMFLLKQKQEVRRLIESHKNGQIPLYYLRLRVHDIYNRNHNNKNSLFNDVNKDKKFNEEVDNYLKNIYFNDALTKQDEKESKAKEKELYTKYKNDFINAWKDKYLTIIQNDNIECIFNNCIGGSKQKVNDINESVGLNENFELKNSININDRINLMVLNLKNQNTLVIADEKVVDDLNSKKIIDPTSTK